MTKAEKIVLANSIFLIEREESAVTGSRLSIFPRVMGIGVARSTARAKVGQRAKLKKKAIAGASSKQNHKRVRITKLARS